MMSHEKSVKQCYLYGYQDATKKAYSALVYFVYHIDDGQTHACLAASKTRVVPFPITKTLHSTVGIDVSSNTGTTEEQSAKCATVTAASRWREILAGHQNSPQLNLKQGRMEAVCVIQSKRDSQADKQGEISKLFDQTKGETSIQQW